MIHYKLTAYKQVTLNRKLILHMTVKMVKQIVKKSVTDFGNYAPTRLWKCRIFQSFVQPCSLGTLDRKFPSIAALLLLAQYHFFRHCSVKAHRQAVNHQQRPPQHGIIRWSLLRIHQAISSHTETPKIWEQVL